MAEHLFKAIKGNKVFLKPFLVDHINDEYIGWLNDKNVMRFSNQRFFVHTFNSCILYKASFEGTNNLFVGIHRLSDDKLIGTLTAYFSIHHGTVDVGIMIGDSSLWGKGFGLDAWVTFTNWLLVLKGIRKLTAGTLACNLGMIKLMERSGMILEATRKSQEIFEGRPEDILYYAKFNEN
jgi:ribosomal-protein-alanine N-acetyltransferase